MLKNIRALIKDIDNSVREVKASAEQLSKISEETQASSEEINSAINEITKGSAMTANESSLAQMKSIELNKQVEMIQLKASDMTVLAQEANHINDNGPRSSCGKSTSKCLNRRTKACY